MRLLFELTVFLVVAGAAVLVGSVVFWLGGLRFGWELRDGVVASLISLFFVVPGGMNLWILIRGSDGESKQERACAGIRGFGMLICGVGVAIPFVTLELRLAPTLWMFGIGSLFWWGSILVEDFIAVRNLRRLSSDSDSRKSETKE
ncbi:MAG: hypothetical protein HOI66_11405 [Verrucomicrobia bacterium]|jgi:hypothetical protein|nr:hypothetical protein [Verrucomicrobiota bacterium]MDA7667561.1 hypothetical protein [bacterium]